MFKEGDKIILKKDPNNYANNLESSKTYIVDWCVKGAYGTTSLMVKGVKRIYNAAIFKKANDERS